MFYSFSKKEIPLTNQPITLRLGISTNRWKYIVFYGHPSWQATWNDGIVECWNTGYEKRKKIYSTKNVVSRFYDDARQPSIFYLHPSTTENTPILREYQYNYLRFDPLNPTF